MGLDYVFGSGRGMKQTAPRVGGVGEYVVVCALQLSTVCTFSSRRVPGPVLAISRF